MANARFGFNFRVPANNRYDYSNLSENTLRMLQKANVPFVMSSAGPLAPGEGIAFTKDGKIIVDKEQVKQWLDFGTF